MNAIGCWGLHTQIQPRFGARALVERKSVSLLWDRTGIYGDADDLWLAELNAIIPDFITQLSALFQRGELLCDQDKLVTLRQGEWICMANPKASYGYLYLNVFRQEISRVSGAVPEPYR